MKINILEFSVIILAVGWDCLFIIGSVFAQYSVELPWQYWSLMRINV